MTRSRSLWRWLAAGTCALMAPFSALAALQMVAEERSGLTPSMTPLPLQTGFAKAQQAARMLRTDAQLQDGSDIVVEPETADAIVQISHRALTAESYNVAALRNLAVIALANGDERRSLDLLTAAGQMSRRDVQTSLLLARAHAREDDMAQTVAAFDSALRTSTAARAMLLPALVRVMAQDEAVTPVARLLENEPGWEADFWTVASNYPAALPNIARLRGLRAEDGRQVAASRDRALFKALVTHRHFAAAERLSKALGGPVSQRGDAVRNAGFTRLPGPGPFDWDLRRSGTMSSSIDPAAGQLRGNTYSNGGGVMARQLVALDAPAHRLRVAASEWDRRDAGSLTIRLSCAERIIQPLESRIEGPGQLSVLNPDTACRYHWLELVLHPQSDRRDNTLILDEIILEPVQADDSSDTEPR